METIYIKSEETCDDDLDDVIFTGEEIKVIYSLFCLL